MYGFNCCWFGASSGAVAEDPMLHDGATFDLGLRGWQHVACTGLGKNPASLTLSPKSFFR